jgi:hypothetical protein
VDSANALANHIAVIVISTSRRSCRYHHICVDRTEGDIYPVLALYIGVPKGVRTWFTGRYRVLRLVLYFTS